MGKTINDAKAELEAQGFRVRVRNLGNSGVVRYQRPAPSSERPPGSEVHLWQ
jgi:serine/threonine-protein kinase